MRRLQCLRLRRGGATTSSAIRCCRQPHLRRHLSSSRPATIASHPSLSTDPSPSSASLSSAPLSPPLLPSALYSSLVSSSLLTPDSSQLSVLPLLDDLTRSLVPHQLAMQSYWQALDHHRHLRQQKILEETNRRASPTPNPTPSLLSRVSSLFSSPSPNTSSHPHTLPPPELLSDAYYGLPPPPIAPPPPRGLYLHGSVGCGKTLLLDLLFASTSSLLTHRRRVHYHAFILHLFSLLHTFHCLPSRGVQHPMDYLAAQLVPERHLLLLAFDEVQMTDPTEVRLLLGLFHRLFARGVVMVATGNRGVEEMNRSMMVGDEEWGEMVKEWTGRCRMVHMSGGKDWRRERRDGKAGTAAKRTVGEVMQEMGGDQGGAFPVRGWLSDRQVELLASSPSFPSSPSSPLSRVAFDALYSGLCSLAPTPSSPPPHLPAYLPLHHGRTLEVHDHHPSGICRFSFTALCGRPLGPADYLALASHYHTVFLYDVPEMTSDKRDQVRRFITLVDQLYNSHVVLVMVVEGRGVEVMGEGEVELSEVVEGTQFELEAMRKGVGSGNRDVTRGGSLYSGEDERFALQRCVSRLCEMATTAYIKERRWKAASTQLHEARMAPADLSVQS